jgi:hypothetical protein
MMTGVYAAPIAAFAAQDYARATSMHIGVPGA